MSHGARMTEEEFARRFGAGAALKAPGVARSTDRGASGSIVLSLTPVPKPRMTQRDKWLDPPRPGVMRYRRFCEELRRACGPFIFPACGAHVTFYLPMPASWTKKRRREMDGQPHTQRPDVDNCCKALLDGLHTDDSHIWDIRITKRWGAEGKIVIQSGRGRHDIETNTP